MMSLHFKALYYKFMKFFLIPGNPPATYFYEQWGNEIKALQGDANVCVSHYPDLKHGTNSLDSMAEVMEFHFKQLEKFCDQVQVPVVIIGHSLGGYFALKLLEEAPEQIQKRD